LLSFWDYLLIAVVTVHATILAYTFSPRWKALLLTLPIPFTIASLAVGQPVDATNVLGLILLLLFTNGVRWLHCTLKGPIVPAIVISALGYCLLAWLLAGVLPKTEQAFWIATTGTFALSTWLLLRTPHREEPGHRSPLPLWIKLPSIMLVVLGLVLVKQNLQGFMTVFPMVGVIAVYEARKSLWTISRQIPLLAITLIPLMITCRETQLLGDWPLPLALAAGWVVFLLTLIPLTLALREADRKVAARQTEEAANSARLEPGE